MRCVEVTLNGWDSHVNNLETQRARVATLDPAFAALIRDLKRRELLRSTVVVCGGEFGRTPRINPAGGRDHWPYGFSIALAGGGIAGGRVVGETADKFIEDPDKRLAGVVDPVRVADVHATIFQALGVNYDKIYNTHVGRPMKFCDEGQPIEKLLS